MNASVTSIHPNHRRKPTLTWIIENSIIANLRPLFAQTPDNCEQRPNLGENVQTTNTVQPSLTAPYHALHGSKKGQPTVSH